MKSRKETIEIEITLIDKNCSYIIGALTARLPTEEVYPLIVMRGFTLQRSIEKGIG